ncbi:hypothetical protein Acsp03_25000 [Actinomadura sp. NBRC 104412]|uniref:MFS transporter small subunit n=1 Tax=Actinomadura sp. NBRC 104412 TaxID=3032203 RepID=UPI0024A2B48A|nr:hypothetical protein [Actinomadura sp. NBRC 104412]GLZ05034.1 hypothetical protein Acsp03_25000 [Actinomadura sp. NBRC 104412]
MTAPASAPAPGTEEHASGKYKAQLVIAWTIVGIPLAYGVYNAVKAALKLFGG